MLCSVFLITFLTRVVSASKLTHYERRQWVAQGSSSQGITLTYTYTQEVF